MMVKVGADLRMEMATRQWLWQHDMETPERYQAELESENIIEVSLEVANKIKVDIISVVESEINEEWWENHTDTDQFLVHGQVREVNWETTLFLQGYGWSK